MSEKQKKRQKMHIKKKDLVQVIAGKEVGKRGKVLKVDPERGRVVVEKLNFIYKHRRASRTYKQGGIIEVEGFMDASNVMIVCPTCNKPVRIRKKILADGSKVRICHKCGEVLDK